MATIQVLSDAEQGDITVMLREFADLADAPEDTDLSNYLFDEIMGGDGEVEVRFFPSPEQGAAEEIYFEIRVRNNAEWYDSSLGAYGADNLRNGGPVYQAFADELESIVEEVLGESVDFVQNKGHGAFTATVSL